MAGGNDPAGGSSVEGTWMLAGEAGAMMVGPSANSGEYWMNSIEDVTARACLFDDKYVFNEDGSFRFLPIHRQ